MRRPHRFRHKSLRSLSGTTRPAMHWQETVQRLRRSASVWLTVALVVLGAVAGRAAADEALGASCPQLHDVWWRTDPARLHPYTDDCYFEREQSYQLEPATLDAVKLMMAVADPPDGAAAIQAIREEPFAVDGPARGGEPPALGEDATAPWEWLLRREVAVGDYGHLHANVFYDTWSTAGDDGEDVHRRFGPAWVNLQVQFLQGVCRGSLVLKATIHPEFGLKPDYYAGGVEQYVLDAAVNKAKAVAAATAKIPACQATSTGAR